MPYTREQKREYDRHWTTERRERAIKILGGRCVKCGSTEQLEFDHVDRTTKDPKLKGGGITWTRAWEWIVTELVKCQLLCRKCHEDKSRSEIGDVNRGEQSGNAKLTESDILAIRASGEPYRKIAEKYDVDHTLIYQIKKRKIWKHI